MIYKVKSVYFKALNEVACDVEEKELTAGNGHAVIETRYSCISAGTELAKLTGLQQVGYPLYLGNRAIARVLEAGPGCRVRQGNLVFTHSLHQSPTLSAMLLTKIPDSLDRPEASMMGMALVAFTGMRVARPELGDTAVITGAGLVGNFAAQLMELSGVTAIIIDKCAGRLNIAEQCGISHCINSAETDPREAVMEITGGKGADFVLECTGVPAVACQCPADCGPSATMVLVGSPRGEYNADLTEFLLPFHLWGSPGDLTLKAAHEWKIPLYGDEFSKHSQERNAQVLAKLMESGSLKSRELLSPTFRPEECAEAYAALKDRKDEFLGVVFDWTKE